jgi:hypothetical protein
MSENRNTLPAPWVLNSFCTRDGRVIHEIVAANGRAFLRHEDKGLLEEVAASRNEATADDDLREQRARFDQMIAVRDRDVERLRAKYGREMNELRDYNTQLLDEIERIKEGA